MNHLSLKLCIAKKNVKYKKKPSITDLRKVAFKIQLLYNWTPQQIWIMETPASLGIQLIFHRLKWMLKD